MKGEKQLWRILQDKLEMLRAGERFPEALRVAETAIELAQRTFAEDDPSLAQSYERLGQIHDLLGHAFDAKHCFTQALSVIEKAEPIDERAIFRLSRRLGYLCDIDEREEEAIIHYERAIEAGRQLANVPHSELGTMLNNVALIYRRIGRQAEAEPCYLRALELYEEQLGLEHPDVAAVLNNLGVFYTSDGRLEEAEQAHERALAIRRRANPNGRSDIAQSHSNLAVVYHSRGEFDRAGELYRESLRGWENLEKPPEDYEIVASNYADLLRSLGKKRKAATIESRARKRRAL
ncbi:MAG: tetratricopeptide repeat protein [Spartobacteria bacterium]